jgi:hypothetical protein
MKKIFILVLIFLCTHIAKAKDNWYSINYGLGTNKHQRSLTEVKLITLQMKNNLIKETIQQTFEVGYYADNTAVSRNNAFIDYMLGVEAKSKSMFISGNSGIGFLSKTDPLLSTSFQFIHELTFGMYEYNETNKSKIGLSYRHISNAGIKQPNFGRDFIAIKFSFSL